MVFPGLSSMNPLLINVFFKRIVDCLVEGCRTNKNTALFCFIYLDYQKKYFCVLYCFYYYCFFLFFFRLFCLISWSGSSMVKKKASLICYSVHKLRNLLITFFTKTIFSVFYNRNKMFEKFWQNFVPSTHMGWHLHSNHLEK